MVTHLKGHYHNNWSWLLRHLRTFSTFTIVIPAYHKDVAHIKSITGTMSPCLPCQQWCVFITRVTGYVKYVVHFMDEWKMHEIYVLTLFSSSVKTLSGNVGRQPAAHPVPSLSQQKETVLLCNSSIITTLSNFTPIWLTTASMNNSVLVF